ncbi:FRG domain-containing protein [Bacteroides fragilis]|nr:FRG domain-containing protein [Bacteroides fragilis]
MRFFFRGVPNSAYKIYSSIQRCCSERNNQGQNILMPELSKEILRRFNNSVILMEAFNKEVPQPSNNSDLAKWAFIQHFGGPSHFVDFTPDINRALFFALPKLGEETYSADTTDLNNYISVYVYQDNPYKNGNLNKMYESSSQRGRDLFIDATKKYPNILIDTTEVDRQMLTQPLDSIFWGTSIYGEDMFKVILPGDGNNNDMSLNNSHISKQKGNFFLGNIEDIIPLELAPNLRTKRWDNMGKEYYCPYGYCLDIHKSLIPEIRNNFSIPLENDIYTPYDYIPEAKSELKSLWSQEN